MPSKRVHLHIHPFLVDRCFNNTASNQYLHLRSFPRPHRLFAQVRHKLLHGTEVIAPPMLNFLQNRRVLPTPRSGHQNAGTATATSIPFFRHQAGLTHHHLHPHFCFRCQSLKGSPVWSCCPFSLDACTYSRVPTSFTTSSPCSCPSFCKKKKSPLSPPPPIPQTRVHFDHFLFVFFRVISQWILLRSRLERHRKKNVVICPASYGGKTNKYIFFCYKFEWLMSRFIIS